MALLLACAPAMAAPPQRVMSLNLCADQLLLNLLPPSRITSVSYLSRERYESYLSPQALHIAINYGTAEEVVSQKPDLVLAGRYSTAMTRLMIRHAGIALLELDSPSSFQQIRDLTRKVAHAVGAEQRGEQLLQQMDAALTRLAASAPQRPIRVVVFDGSGDVYGKDTLVDAIISAAGATNVGAPTGARQGKFGVEDVLMVHADLLASGDATAATPALATAPLSHPALRAMYSGRRIIFPELLYGCGLPQSAQAAVQLRDVMQKTLQALPR